MPDAWSLKGLRWIPLATLAALVVGCATEPPPRPTALDPANPAAPESALLTFQGFTPPPSPSSLPALPAQTAMADAGAPPAMPPPTIYVCPMHPEVTSDKPGRCPKCGMTLVPKTRAEPSARERKQ